MNVARRISDASIWFYGAVRSPRAADTAEAPPSGSLESLAGHKYALVVTYRRSGDAVPTPVWFGIEGGCLYFRSVATGHKLRRIAESPHVLVAPCTASGRPTGAPFRASARILASSEEEALAERAIRSNYGIARRLYARLIAPRVPGRYVEVCP